MHVDVRVINAMCGAHAQQLADKDSDAECCSEIVYKGKVAIADNAAYWCVSVQICA